MDSMFRKIKKNQLNISLKKPVKRFTSGKFER